MNTEDEDLIAAKKALKEQKRRIKEKKWTESVQRAKKLSDDEWLEGLYIEENGYREFSRRFYLAEKKALMNSPEDLKEKERIDRKEAAEERKMMKIIDEKNRLKMEDFQRSCAEERKNQEKSSSYVEIIYIIAFIIFVLFIINSADHSSYDEDSGSDTYGRYGQQ